MIKTITKRLFDLIFSLIAIIILTIPYIIIALIIIIDLKAWPIFVQKRNGENLKKFPLYKFRTMKVKEDGIDNFKQVTKNDGRVTKIGNFLRKT